MKQNDPLDNDNHEYLKGISQKAKNSAIQTLEIAKIQEAEKLKSGWAYELKDDKTYVLKPKKL